MRKALKIAAIICTVCLLTGVYANAATDSWFSFSFPTDSLDCLCYDTVHTRTTAAATVTTNQNTTLTDYYLFLDKTSFIIETEAVQATTHGTYSFTFKTGYGGAGTSCVLVGVPDMSVYPWAAYTVNGSWTY